MADRRPSATFRLPNALAIDASGALLVCDSGNERVRRISAGVIQTVAGNGVQGFAGRWWRRPTNAEFDTPMGLAVAGDGRIFVADSHNQRIRVIATNGVITTFAGNGVGGYAGDGGPATAASLALPRGLMVTSSGAVIFADSNNQRLRMVDPSGTISTIAGSGVQGAASDGVAAGSVAMNSPRGVAIVKLWRSGICGRAESHGARECGERECVRAGRPGAGSNDAGDAEREPEQRTDRRGGHRCGASGNGARRRWSCWMQDRWSRRRRWLEGRPRLLRRRSLPGRSRCTRRTWEME